MANRTTWTAVAVGVLLAVGLVAVYYPQLAPTLVGASSLSASEELTYITDLDFWQRTPRERAVLATVDHRRAAIALLCVALSNPQMACRW